jgi:hypothetical protein
MPAARKKLATECGQQPFLRFGVMTQQVAFHGPQQEGLLRQVEGVHLAVCQAQGEPIQRRVVQADHPLEF